METLPFLQHTPVLVEASPNATVMEGMAAELRCRFRSDLATQVMWLRPREGMTGLEEHFDRDDRKNFRFLTDTSSGKPVTGETLTIPREAIQQHDNYYTASRKLRALWASKVFVSSILVFSTIGHIHTRSKKPAKNFDSKKSISVEKNFESCREILKILFFIWLRMFQSVS